MSAVPEGPAGDFSVQGAGARDRRARRRLVAAGAIVLVLAAALTAFAKPWAFLPHDPIVLGLPYSVSDPPDGLIPMGETIHHPDAPRGHPGIDLGWDDADAHLVLAAHGGKVTRVQQEEATGGWTVEVRSGVFVLVHRGLEALAPGVERGARLARGDAVGEAERFCDRSGPDGREHCWSNVHWELASVSPILDRWCPVTYFDEPSRDAIESLWRALPDSRMKTEFPEICSGPYAGRVAS